MAQAESVGWQTIASLAKTCWRCCLWNQPFTPSLMPRSTLLLLLLLLLLSL
jgi:hypothetical protein